MERDLPYTGGYRRTEAAGGGRLAGEQHTEADGVEGDGGASQRDSWVVGAQKMSWVVPEAGMDVAAAGARTARARAGGLCGSCTVPVNVSQPSSMSGVRK
jgi:hypothetical protein